MADLQLEDRKRNWGCTIFGWLLFILAFAFLILVGMKTTDYYGKLRRGEIVELPQFREQFTSSKKAVLDRSSVNRDAVETADAPSVGADEGAVLTIVEFADFECPYSKQESSVVRSLVTKYGDKVRLIYRDYPLEDIHLNARNAALAAECANEQGKFWAYHDKLYAQSPVLGLSDLQQYAEQAGLDGKQFEKCLADERYKDKVDKDAADAVALGVSGTPVFFFNGQKVEGAIPMDSFERLVKRMIAQ